MMSVRILRTRRALSLPALGLFCGQGIEGREARRPSGRAANKIRACNQPQHRQADRPHDSTECAGASRQGDSMKKTQGARGSQSGQAYSALADKSVYGIKRLLTGSTARKRLSRATAPSKAGPSGTITHGVVISSPFRESRASAMGQTSRCPPAITTR